METPGASPRKPGIGEIALTSGDNLDNLQSVSLIDVPIAKFRGRNRLSVLFDHDTPGREVLANQKFVNSTRHVNRDFVSVGNDDSRIHNRFRTKVAIRVGHSSFPLIEFPASTLR